MRLFVENQIKMLYIKKDPCYFNRPRSAVQLSPTNKLEVKECCCKQTFFVVDENVESTYIQLCLINRFADEELPLVCPFIAAMSINDAFNQSDNTKFYFRWRRNSYFSREEKSCYCFRLFVHVCFCKS